MRIILYIDRDDRRTNEWKSKVEQSLSNAELVAWTPSTVFQADYALVWKPPAELLKSQNNLKAVIHLAAGVDGLLQTLRDHPGVLNADIPILRLEDAGMAEQMVQYACYHVLRFHRQMAAYDAQRNKHVWKKLPAEPIDRFTVGVLGMGVMGRAVALALANLGFPVSGWSRSRHELPGVSTFGGADQLPAFLRQQRVLVNLLPLTPDTENILNMQLFKQLARPAYVINMGRGNHLVEPDLLHAIAQEHVAGAALDVFRQEPLPEDHPFWNEPRVQITPHIAAVTQSDAAVRQVVQKLHDLEQGKEPLGTVDRLRGY